MKLTTSILPITTVMTLVQSIVQTKLMLAMVNTNNQRKKEVTLLSILIPVKAQDAIATAVAGNAHMTTAAKMQVGTMALIKQAVAWVANHMAMMGGILALYLVYKVLSSVMSPIAALTTTLIIGAAAWMAYNGAMTMGLGTGAAIAGMVLGVMAVNALFPKQDTGTAGAAAISDIALKFNKERNYDLGGTFMPSYDNGGYSTEHGMAILQKGETVIPKTQNMLSGGITLNFGDINAQDGTDFAEKVASALPDAIRRVNDQGAI